MPLFIAGLMNAATITVGVNDSGNCYPFSCGPSDDLTRYQQVYTASAFGSTPFYINSLTFFLSQEGPMDEADYTLSLSTTSASVTTLSDDLDSNVGADMAIFTST